MMFPAGLFMFCVMFLVLITDIRVVRLQGVAYQDPYFLCMWPLRWNLDIPCVPFGDDMWVLCIVIFIDMPFPN
jgi:hypothetical protein